MSEILRALNDAKNVLETFSSNSENINKIENAIEIFANTLKADGKILACGNGGSMCDSMHFVEELTGRYKKDRKPLAAISMADAGHITCVANDFGFDEIFSRNVEAWGRKGDSLLAISTSGNSKNIIRAVEVAKSQGMKTVGLLGKGGGQLKDMVDVALIIPSAATERIQEVHIKLIHIFIEGIEGKLFTN